MAVSDPLASVAAALQMPGPEEPAFRQRWRRERLANSTPKTRVADGAASGSHLRTSTCARLRPRCLGVVY